MIYGVNINKESSGGALWPWRRWWMETSFVSRHTLFNGHSSPGSKLLAHELNKLGAGNARRISLCIAEKRPFFTRARIIGIIGKLTTNWPIKVCEKAYYRFSLQGNLLSSYLKSLKKGSSSRTKFYKHSPNVLNRWFELFVFDINGKGWLKSNSAVWCKMNYRDYNPWKSKKLC